MGFQVPNFLGDGGSEEPARLALAEWLREGDEKRQEGFARFAESEVFGELSPREHADLCQVWAGLPGAAARL